MLAFHVNLYCPKAYHSICIAEQHTKKIAKSSTITKTQTHGSFWFVTLVPAISSLKQKIFFVSFFCLPFFPS
jgi:hypothetical protein